MLTLFTFYRNFILVSISTTIIGCISLVQAGSPYAVLTVFWMKIIVGGLLGVLHFIFRPQSFYFYHNKGFSLQQLYGYSFLIDILLWLIFSILTIKFFL